MWQACLLLEPVAFAMYWCLGKRSAQGGPQFAYHTLMVDLTFEM